MGQLYGPDPNGRMSNSTDIEDVDNGVAELERDIGQIFGVPLLTAITGPIFKLSSDLTSSVHTQVQSDGSVDGTLVFRRASATIPDTAPGIVFENQGTNTQYKLTCTGENLGLWYWDTSVVPTGEWLLKANLNNVATSIFALEDVLEDDFSGATAGDVLVVNATKDGLEFAAPTGGGGGAVNLADLGDVLPYDEVNEANFVLAVNSGGGTYWRDLVSGTAGDITDLDDVYGNLLQQAGVQPEDRGKSLVIDNTPTGTKVVFDKVSAGYSSSQHSSTTGQQNQGVASTTLALGESKRLLFRDVTAGDLDNYFIDGLSSPYYNDMNFFRDGYYSVVFKCELSAFTTGYVRVSLEASNPAYTTPLFTQSIKPAVEFKVDSGGGVQAAGMYQYISLVGYVLVKGVGDWTDFQPKPSDLGRCITRVSHEGSSISLSGDPVDIIFPQWFIHRLSAPPQ